MNKVVWRWAAWELCLSPSARSPHFYLNSFELVLFFIVIR